MAMVIWIRDWDMKRWIVTIPIEHKESGIAQKMERDTVLI